jgi:hypothetical protein
MPLLRQEVLMRRRHVGTQHVTFEAEDGHRIVAVTADDYLDMGSPDMVTVRIEPGDQLNA